MLDLRARAIRASIVCAVGLSGLLTTPTAAAEEPSTKASEQRHGGRRSCRGIRVPSGANLQVAINRARKGAKLCLGRGTYFTRSGITLRSEQKLVGVTRSKTVIKTSGAIVIDARKTTGVKIKRLSVTGANGGRRCAPGCGRGISPGRKTKIVRVRVHHNQVVGIGGSRGGLVIKKSEVDHNGHRDLYGCCTGAIKTGTAYTIKDTYVHDNVGVGIWCDVGCKGGKWRVLNNVSVRNTLGGIRYETAGAHGSALIRGNAVRRNNRLGSGGHGGIEINSSRNAVVEKNRVRRNRGPGIIIGGNRRPGLGNIMVRYNVLTYDHIQKCGGPVSCRGNR